MEETKDVEVVETPTVVEEAVQSTPVEPEVVVTDVETEPVVETVVEPVVEPTE